MFTNNLVPLVPRDYMCMQGKVRKVADFRLSQIPEAPHGQRRPTHQDKLKKITKTDVIKQGDPHVKLQEEGGPTWRPEGGRPTWPMGPPGFWRVPMAVESGGKEFPSIFLAPRPPLGTYIRRGTPPHTHT